jgi:hypothetical protein
MAGGRFQPGNSGNPGGRPKEIAHLKELARQHTPEAIHILAAIMMDAKEPAAARVRAAEALLDRGWGKPAQQISGEFINRNVRKFPAPRCPQAVPGRETGRPTRKWPSKEAPLTLCELFS